MNDRLEPLMHRRVMYTVTDQDGIYTGTVERDSYGVPYIQDINSRRGNRNKSTHLYIRMKKQKITLKFAQIFIFIFVTFFA